MASLIDMNNCIFLLFCIILTVLLQYMIFKKLTKATTNTKFNLPPSPPALPLIGHLHLLTPALYKCFYNLSSKYGPLLYLRLGSSRCLLVSSASMATEIFKINDLAFSSRPLFAFADKLPYGTSGFVTAPYGDYWKFMKKLCVTELLGPRQFDRSSGVRSQEIMRFMVKLLEKASKNEVVDLGAELTKLTNNIACRMVMSTTCLEEDGETKNCRELVKQSFELAAKLCFGEVLGPLKPLGYWIYGKQAMNLANRYDELFERILKEHESRASREGWKNEHADLLDILLHVYEDEKVEVKITRTQIKAFLLDLFIAGTETSAKAIQWAIAELINHPSIFKKVREEIESVVGKARVVEESDISSLPYLQAVVKETLRLHPPSPVTTRECRKSCKIKGFDIPEKTAVAISLFAIMRDPDVWDRPNEFYPERFLGCSKELDNMDHGQRESKVQNFGFVPFGGGRRGCPGAMLAYNLIYTVIAAMVQCFDWEVNGQGAEAKVNMEAGSGMSMGMAHPLLCFPVVYFKPLTAKRYEHSSIW